MSSVVAGVSSKQLSLSLIFFLLLLSPLLLLLLLLRHPPLVLAHCHDDTPPVIFNFGDSNSDTGGLVSGLGFPVDLPNGRAFFNRSTGRLSDGRLLIDFLCQSLNGSLLKPYLDSLGGSDFRNGANFAVVGSATLPRYVPFSLNIQVMQFLHFKARSLQLVAAGSSNLIDDKGFQKALYMIDIGQNDLADSFSKNLTLAQVIEKLPSFITEIRNAVKTLYDQGGRKFWIHNTGPLGCLPQKLTVVKNNDLDPHGCLSSYNSAAKLFNQGLLKMCEETRHELQDANIVYVDIYAIKYNLITNSTENGFSNPLMACCGFGGPPYNYNIKVTCGQPGYQVCAEGSQFISWDGVHYSEAANGIIASKVLSTLYSTPQEDQYTHKLLIFVPGLADSVSTYHEMARLLLTYKWKIGSDETRKCDKSNTKH